ncbi:Methyltransferase type 11 [Kribbella flavida DSM 17836]|uniref:Methyltransferase type 11 n=1 Tax=Kribbella flavida (strain DSM 17836 / JCM 10339 / NBRC 14399) TaxID=479435 RepID=D2PYS2_KRIFD|nr:class I SAM-dependent methyltransferase [Kribbella flavida]ADB29918.1 Methyltransferase type 11 [Kribbella flavida DSM 17836]
MNEGYVEGFAQAYDRFWHPYPNKSAKALLKLVRSAAPQARRVLDVGCGTGIVAEHFLQAGFGVTGIDRSPAMLALARARLGDGPALYEADAADFTMDEQFPVVVSTYDIPNHLDDLDRVAAYLGCVYRATAPGGLFAFDIATVEGLRGMNKVQIRDTEEAILLFRGALNEAAGLGFYRISGVVQAADGRYDRFETTMTNIVVPVDRVLSLMADTGWVDSYVASPDDLLTPLPEPPEDLPHLYLVGHKQA